MKLPKIQTAFNVILWIVITIWLLSSHTFKDVFFFWMLSGISYSLQVLGIYVGSFFLVWRHSQRIKLAMSEVDPIKVINGARKVYEWDSNEMPAEEFNKYYERIGDAVGAKVWKDKNGFVNEISARNIAAQFIGINTDPEVIKFIHQQGKSTEDSK